MHISIQFQDYFNKINFGTLFKLKETISTIMLKESNYFGKELSFHGGKKQAYKAKWNTNTVVLRKLWK